MPIGELDPHSGVRTTGHEWSGITELDNPIPLVVMLAYALTLAIALLMWILYPAWPLVTTYSPGVLGWSQQEQLESQLQDVARENAAWSDRIMAMDLTSISRDAELREFALRRGARLFGDNCSVCHGRVGQGAPGFPNLTDDSWIWGGALEQIHETVRVGINTNHEETRYSEMPAFGKDKVLERPDIKAVVAYVRTLSGIQTQEDLDTEGGRTIFAENCADCHGEDGRGNAEVGAPNLTDGVWIYESGRGAVFEIVFNGRQGHMPYWSDRLDAVQMKVLAIYVSSLGRN
jgi:cytochrome c oxidase cbb3-type subunit 3